MDKLLLQLGSDIPCPEIRINIHQPTCKEIALIGESSFFLGIELLNFSKEKMTEKDKVGLENYTNFDIIMSIIQNTSDAKLRKAAEAATNVLFILLSNYELQLLDRQIILKDSQNEEYIINAENYQILLNIVNEMFNVFDKDVNDYNPGSAAAQAIADKLRKGRQKAAEIKGQNKDKNKSVISRYISILSVGLKLDMNSFDNYTLYQLFDEFKRYKMKIEYDIHVQAKLAGAENLPDVANWMSDYDDIPKANDDNWTEIR